MAKASKSKKNKTSSYRKYRDGYWIKSRYLLYRFWYKFLQYAELDPNRKVDWAKYDGWGGPAVVLNEPFEKWWEKRWKKLFGVRQLTNNARYEIANKKARAEAIRIAVVVYEHRHLINAKDNRPIFEALNAKYEKLGGLDRCQRGENGEVLYRNGKPLEREIQTKDLNREVKRYLKKANSFLDQVCRGEFG
ncbi:hypothetical protein KF707_19540 [Candidatus Obscuribacterales bacterium]|nr:hypothetical protein [Cyclobacteriaceae bacterium]MBX3138430.1 hypothetical protein [Candidatus Obscuribacterales bacterium]